MKQKIIGVLFFISLTSFCVEGSMVFTLIGFSVFCSCAGYIIKHQDEFLQEEEITKKKVVRTKVRKNKDRKAA